MIWSYPLEGWARPSNLKKAHYFDENKQSLCGQWSFEGPQRFAEDGNIGPFDCQACRKKLEKR